jgi:hypothetical protein
MVGAVVIVGNGWEVLVAGKVGVFAVGAGVDVFSVWLQLPKTRDRMMVGMIKYLNLIE